MKKDAFINNRYIVFLGFVLTLWACRNTPQNIYQQATFDASGGIQAVIEIPAGTNKKMEYRPDKGTFLQDTLNGEKRIIQFLPYPGNYGFIPSTQMDEVRGGDGDALDILVLCESLPQGTTIATRPIGVLMLRDQGKVDTKIIAIPVDSSLQVIAPADYEDFVVRYNAAHHIVQEWFMNYKGLGVMELIGWQDEQYALREIEKWRKK